MSSQTNLKVIPNVEAMQVSLKHDFFLTYEVGIAKGRGKAIRKKLHLQVNGNDLITRETLFPDAALVAYL